MTAKCDCGRLWESLIEAHCPTCHLHFGSVQGFDRHRVGDVNKDTGPNRRRCADPTELIRKDGNPVLVPLQRAGGPAWVVWHAKLRPQQAADKAVQGRAQLS